MVCLSKLHNFKFFKGCLPQILLGPFLNTYLLYIYSLHLFFTFNNIPFLNLQLKFHTSGNVQKETTLFILKNIMKKNTFSYFSVVVIEIYYRSQIAVTTGGFQF